MDSLTLRRALLACLGTLCIVVMAYQSRHPRGPVSPVQTLSPSPRFEALVARLNAAVVQDGAKIRRSTALMPVYDASGARNITCSVECDDENGQTLYNVFWNEQTRCYQISFQPPIRKVRSQHRLTNAAGAATAAREWMDDLGITPESDHWQVASRPERIRCCWQITLKSPDREALLTLMESTGEITRANVNVLSYAPGDRPKTTAQTGADPLR